MNSPTYLWIGNCPAIENSRCLFVDKPFSSIFLAATCSCDPCFKVDTTYLNVYSAPNGMAISAQTDFFSTTVQLHDAVVPSDENVANTFLVEACAGDVVIDREDTVVSGENAVPYPELKLEEPPLKKPPRPPSPPLPPLPPPPSPAPPGSLCLDDASACPFIKDGECDDGGEGSVYDLCDAGNDCFDCGPRQSLSPVDGDDGEDAKEILYWVGCGRAKFQKCSEEEHFAVESEQHEVRCCSETFIEGFSQQHGCDIYGESWVNGNCHHEKTVWEADAICASVGARLCTREELEADCARGTGCGHDRDLVWTSTTM